IVPRRRRLGVPERVGADGSVVTPLDEEGARHAIERLKRQDTESVAIVTLFSFKNPDHELRLAELVAEMIPDAQISLSHEIMPKASEFERTSTTVLNAYVAPRVTAYLDRLQDRLGDVRLMIMQSTGGVMSRQYMRRRPIQVLSSGPAGGVIGCAAVGVAKSELNLLCVDMGGTSYDVSLVRDGEAPSEPGWNWHHRYLCGLPMVTVTTVGAGGGSIAHVTSGVLQVGPESAGADPGPVCYGRGGTRPTVTDANLLLGLLSPDGVFAGGRFRLTTEGVAEAFREHVAQPMGHHDAERAALYVRRMVNANMSQAVRRLTAERGVDPVTLTMLAYGGNGAVHACVQAEDLGIRKVLVPKSSATFSALGLLVAQPLIDEERSYLVSAAEADLDWIAALWSELVQRATGYFEQAGFSEDAVRHEYQLNFRYPGQNWSLAVIAAVESSTTSPRIDEVGFAEAVEAFHALHEREHTYARRDETPELTGDRALTSASVATTKFGSGMPDERRLAERSGRRRACLADHFGDVDVFAGTALAPGDQVNGPAIIEEAFTTIVVNDGWTATVDSAGDVLLDRNSMTG
ncbi:MAG: N-methylhydantoinase, partial [Mycobacterium sp.]|nr:N-methylhydantoinase [Mycobacterium sp.]